MTEDETEESQEVEEEDVVEELTLEQRQDALKKSRWNVFMYLGLAALFFGFGLYPFIGFTMEVEEGIGSTEFPLQVWGIPVPGEDFTDIPVEVEILVESLPSDVDSIHVYIIENPNGCDATDGSIETTRSNLLTGEADHPHKFAEIDNPVVSNTYNLEFNIDPGIYCVQLVINSAGGSFQGTNVQANVDIYPTQLPLAIIGVVCLALSGFAFIGAQKHGKYVKSLTEPKDEVSIEDAVLSETAREIIKAGPTGAPPVKGPSGPPTGPSGPPATEPAPAGPPATMPEPVVETTPEVAASEPQPQAQPEPQPQAQPVEEATFESNGDGWFFKKYPDGTYDEKVYMMHEGQYVPYEPTE